jgi:hypothetical protein
MNEPEDVLKRLSLLQQACRWMAVMSPHPTAIRLDTPAILMALFRCGSKCRPDPRLRGDI